MPWSARPSWRTARWWSRVTCGWTPRARQRRQPSPPRAPCACRTRRWRNWSGWRLTRPSRTRVATGSAPRSGWASGCARSTTSCGATECSEARGARARAAAPLGSTSRRAVALHAGVQLHRGGVDLRPRLELQLVAEALLVIGVVEQVLAEEGVGRLARAAVQGRALAIVVAQQVIAVVVRLRGRVELLVRANLAGRGRGAVRVLHALTVLRLDGVGLVAHDLLEVGRRRTSTRQVLVHQLAVVPSGSGADLGRALRGAGAAGEGVLGVRPDRNRRVGALGGRRLSAVGERAAGGDWGIAHEHGGPGGKLLLVC